MFQICCKSGTNVVLIVKNMSTGAWLLGFSVFYMGGLWTILFFSYVERRVVSRKDGGLMV